MPRAKNAQTRLAIALESTKGTQATTGFKFIRATAMNVGQNIETAESQEIRAGRNPVGAIRTNVTGAGGWDFEIAHDPWYDDFIQASMFSTWSTLISLTSKDIDISGASGNAFTLTDGLASGAFQDAVVGQWLRLSGYTTNGTIFARVTVKTSNDSVDCVGFRSTGVAVTNETVGAVIAVRGSRIRVGTATTNVSFTGIREHQDTTPKIYRTWVELTPGRWSQTVRLRGINTGRADFLGRFPATTDTTAPTGFSGASAAESNQVTNSIDHVLGVQIKTTTGTPVALGTPTSESLSEITFDLDNQLKDLGEIGRLGPAEIAEGRVRLTGTIQMYLQNRTLIADMENGSVSALSFILQDDKAAPSTANGYVYTLPALDLGNVVDTVEGPTGAVLVRYEWAAKPDATDVAFQVDRFQT